MFDNWISTGKAITIRFFPELFQAALNEGELTIDLDFAANAVYIDNNGT
jgi:hypothetical protein